MIKLFNQVSAFCSRKVTETYSTSFSTAVNLLSPKIRQDIHNIYGFVRFSDEIVDTFHGFEKERLLNKFEEDTYEAIQDKISLNPILNSFQFTINKYQIDIELVKSFLYSMRLDLHKTVYKSKAEYEEYIYGSADVVGLMCLYVFVNGDKEKYDQLKYAAMKLGSSFQKVNFLRDLKADFEDLNRTYFPDTDLQNLTEKSKKDIIDEIDNDFREAYQGILKLPIEAKFGVYTAYRYYKKLLDKLKDTPSLEIKNTRIRVPDYQKVSLLARSYVKYRLNLL